MRATITAAAAIALLAGVAHAQGNGQGNGPGNGSGKGPGERAAAATPGGNGNANRGGGKDKERGNAARVAQGADAVRDSPGNSRGNRAERSNSPFVPDDALRGNGNGNGNADRGRSDGQRARGNGPGDRLVVIEGRGRSRDGFDREVVRVTSFAAIPGRGVVAGCPPGLAKKRPSCVPPGQVRNALRGYDRPDFWGLSLGDGRYWYDDGYLVSLAPDGSIGGYVPLLAGALGIGSAWPNYYQPVALPEYYESYYGLGQYDSYRYADNVVYRIDPQTEAITSIAALLTGDQFTVGQPMPAGYDIYNVPYSYREEYYDTPDSWYRYSDGYVYEVDPETRLIAAAIELLAS